MTSDPKAALVQASSEAEQLKGLVQFVQDAEEATAVLAEVQELDRALRAKLDRLTAPLVSERRSLLEKKRAIEDLAKPALDLYEYMRKQLKLVIARGVDAQEAARRRALESAATPAEIQRAVDLPTIAASTYSEVCYEVEDFAQVPDEYKLLNVTAVKNAGEKGVSIPGVKIWKETRVRAPSRSH